MTLLVTIDESHLLDSPNAETREGYSWFPVALLPIVRAYGIPCPGGMENMLPTELFHSVYLQCDVDTKLLLGKAINQVSFKPGKVNPHTQGPQGLQALLTYDPTSQERRFIAAPLNHGHLILRQTGKPWVLSNRDTHPWYQLQWNKFRVIRRICWSCDDFQYVTLVSNGSTPVDIHDWSMYGGWSAVCCGCDRQTQ